MQVLQSKSNMWSPDIIDLSFCVSEFLQIAVSAVSASYTSLSCIPKQGRMKNSPFLCTEEVELSLGYEKRESINTFPVILVLYELLNGKYSFRKDGLQVSLYCRPLWRVKWGNISLESSDREVFKVASFYSAEMKEDQWRN